MKKSYELDLYALLAVVAVCVALVNIAQAIFN